MGGGRGRNLKGGSAVRGHDRKAETERERVWFSQQLHNTFSLVSPDLICGEVDNGWDEVLPHDDGADLLPVSRALSQEQANGLQGQFHGCGWIGHGTHFHQVLLLNGLNSYQCQVNNDGDYEEERAVIKGG